MESPFSEIFARAKMPVPKPQPFEEFSSEERTVLAGQDPVEEGSYVIWEGYRAAFPMVIRAMRRNGERIEFGIGDPHPTRRAARIVGWVTAERLRPKALNEEPPR